MQKTPIILTIAGSDSGAGAGIQADIKTGAALSAYVVSALTAVTAQNTRGVTHVHDLPLTTITAQLDALFSDFAIAAIKIGMLSQPDVIDLVSDYLTQHRSLPVVLDPVMVATSGDPLLVDEAVDRLRQRLLPLASVVTPNIPEAQVLLAGTPIRDRSAMAAAAQQLWALGAQAVLLKGGHRLTTDQPSVGSDPSSCDDVLYDGELHWYTAPRVVTNNTHGTGCSLSTAVAVGLARGLQLPAAVEMAKRYIQGAITGAAHREIGQGNGPLDHFFAQQR